MRYEIVHATADNVVKYGADIIKRVVAFNEKYGLRAVPSAVFAELGAQMVAPQPYMLIQAALDDEDNLVGHSVTQVQELFGDRNAMIYQLELDDDAREGREVMMRAAFDQIEAWADEAGCSSIQAWAQNERLAEVFKRFGLEDKGLRFIEMKI